jgi:hypothetical protein
MLIGLVVHGSVDYLLAFTGHYLCLGLVIGLISAPPLEESDLT